MSVLRLGIRWRNCRWVFGACRAKDTHQDKRQAAEWLRKAAKSGSAEAQYHLATLYQVGRGVGPNFSDALSWFMKAVAQQHLAALYDLGSMYEAGQCGRRARHPSRARCHRVSPQRRPTPPSAPGGSSVSPAVCYLQEAEPMMSNGSRTHFASSGLVGSLGCCGLLSNLRNQTQPFASALPFRLSSWS
jgi:hypothetical protein